MCLCQTQKPEKISLNLATFCSAEINFRSRRRSDGSDGFASRSPLVKCKGFSYCSPAGQIAMPLMDAISVPCLPVGQRAPVAGSSIFGACQAPIKRLPNDNDLCRRGTAAIVAQLISPTAITRHRECAPMAGRIHMVSLSSSNGN